jgi:hypothetical protein
MDKLSHRGQATAHHHSPSVSGFPATRTPRTCRDARAYASSRRRAKTENPVLSVWEETLGSCRDHQLIRVHARESRAVRQGRSVNLLRFFDQSTQGAPLKKMAVLVNVGLDWLAASIHACIAGCSELVLFDFCNLTLKIQACLFGYLHRGSHDP